MKVSSSFAAKLFEKLSDGEMYGIDLLRKHAGYANTEAVRLALMSHKVDLQRLGITYYADKINVRLVSA